MIKAYSKTQSCISDIKNDVTFIETFKLETCILDGSAPTIYFCNDDFLIAQTYSDPNDCSGSYTNTLFPFSTYGTENTCTNYNGNFNTIPAAAGYLRFFCESRPTASPTTSPNRKSAVPTSSSSQATYLVQNEYNGLSCDGTAPHQNLYRLNKCIYTGQVMDFQLMVQPITMR